MKRYAIGISVFDNAAKILARHSETEAKKLGSDKYKQQLEQNPQLKRSSGLSLLMAIPQMVLLGLTVESALKAALEGMGYDVPQTHDLERLFKQLPEKRRKKLIDSIDEDDFESKLSQSKDSFEFFRYFGENLPKGKKTFHSEFLNKFKDAIFKEFRSEIESIY